MARIQYKTQKMIQNWEKKERKKIRQKKLFRCNLIFNKGNERRDKSKSWKNNEMWWKSAGEWKDKTPEWQTDCKTRIEITWWIPSSHLFHHQWLHNILSKRFAVCCSKAVTKLISLEFCFVNYFFFSQQWFVPRSTVLAHWQCWAVFSLKHNKLDKRVVLFSFLSCTCVYVCVCAFEPLLKWQSSKNFDTRPTNPKDKWIWEWKWLLNESIEWKYNEINRNWRRKERWENNMSHMEPES